MPTDIGYGMPHMRIELSVDAMRHKIIAALSASEVGLSEAIDSAAKQAMANFDFQGEVQKQVTSNLQTMMADEVKRAIWLVGQSDEFRKLIVGKITQALEERFGE